MRSFWKSNVGLAIGGLIGGLILAILVAFATTEFSARSAAHRDKDEADERAKAVALVTQGILANGGDLFANSMLDCRYRLYKPVFDIPHEDRKSLAGRMSPAKWRTVEKGLDSYRLQYTRSLEDHEFVANDVRQIIVVRERMLNAQQALRKLAGLKARKPQEQDIRSDCKPPEL